ncbi:MLV-related proviral Env polyprotein-like [Apus apus]|uniref:MLV-related proviral Env polyprotein-like n=1 Tax=Apus apus TaxID=8895 RepID=UPI0021F88AF4|nr:MLV-related proviral Env polyprotein-like [Apus apus]
MPSGHALLKKIAEITLLLNGKIQITIGNNNYGGRYCPKGLHARLLKYEGILISSPKLELEGVENGGGPIAVKGYPLEGFANLVGTKSRTCSIVIDVIKVCCRKTLEGVQCDSPEIKQLKTAFIFLKTTPAAEKMIPLVARNNRVDERGRGVKSCGEQNPKNRGGLIYIKKEIVPNDPDLVGPNEVLAGEISLSSDKGIPNGIDTETITTTATNINTQEPRGNSLWKLVQASYQVLNATHPNLTEHCWLCYNIRPPFYEAIGVTTNPKRINGSNPSQCLWKKETSQSQGITLAQVTGQGRCIGNVPHNKKHLCKATIPSNRKPPADWLLPAKNTKWICSSIGVTPCLSLKLFNENQDYCIQVLVVPKIIYHPEEFAYEYQTVPKHHLNKREPFTALTVATLVALGATGVGTGTASLIQQNQKFNSLRAAVDEDLEKVEKSISALEASLRSLSEVALQNRRGLDLLFAQQGGLCVALDEECCVYADHTGVVRDTMTKLREGLEKRKKEREAQQSWYESWFNYSPWMTTLLSTIAGLMILLILGITFGPCILNKVIEIVKGRLEAAHLMLIRAKYEPLDKESAMEEILALSHAELQRFDEQNGKRKRGAGQGANTHKQECDFLKQWHRSSPEALTPRGPRDESRRLLVPPSRRALQRPQPREEPCQGEWVPNLNYQPREWLRIPGAPVICGRFFRSPPVTHTQILKRSPEDLRGSCFTYSWSLPAPATPQQEAEQR